MSREIKWMMDELKELHPDWDQGTIRAVREALQLYDSRHPKWKVCNLCHGTGFLMTYNYHGTCGLCNGDGGHYVKPLSWNTVISIWNRTLIKTGTGKGH